MTKRVHPNVSFKSRVASNLSGAAPKPCVTSINDNAVDYTSTSGKDGVVALTVWRKSLLLNCTGFTVFDCNGNIVFRVDNYVA
ncbi:LURP-one-related family protein, partial [Mycobacterium kansasii]